MVLCCAVEVEDDGGKWSSVFHLAMYQLFNFVANGECGGTEGEKLSLPRLHYQLFLPIWKENSGLPIWKENSGPFRRSKCLSGLYAFVEGVYLKIFLKIV